MRTRTVSSFKSTLNRARSRALLATLIALAMIAALWPDLVNAEVNMKDASYSRRFVDVDAGGTVLARTYESRSTHNGLFGFGWCSPLDTKLEKRGAAGWLLWQCGSSLEFTASGATLKTALPRAGTLTKQGAKWVRRSPDGSLQVFDTVGRLVSWTLQRAPGAARIFYDSDGLPREVLAPSGEALRFQVDPLRKRVTRIEGSGGRSVEYEYRGPDLVKVKNAWNNVYTHSYDSLHNLIRTDFPDRTHEAIDYDADLDRVTSFKGRDGCIEIFSYLPHLTTEPDVKRVTRATALKSCDGRPEMPVVFDFLYGARPDGKLFLAKTRIHQGTKHVETTYHPSSGQVLRSISSKGERQ